MLDAEELLARVEAAGDENKDDGVALGASRLLIRCLTTKGTTLEPLDMVPWALAHGGRDVHDGIPR